MRGILLIAIGMMIGVGLWVMGSGKWQQTKPLWHAGHGDNPNSVNDIFGNPGNWFGKSGFEISYPWQTFKVDAQTTMEEALAKQGEEGMMENDMKHEGYAWKVERDLPCDDKGFCVNAFRIQYHFHPTMDMDVRWHSASIEARVCKDPKDANTCGIIRSGGWFDFGYLYRPDYEAECREQKNRVETEFDRQFFSAEAETKTDIVDEMRCHPTKDKTVVWWGHGGSDLRFQLKVMKDNKREVKLAYFLPINKYYVDGYVKDGIVNLPLGKRYINRFGKLVEGCTQSGLDCIPIEYSNIYLSGDSENEVVGFRQVD